MYTTIISTSELAKHIDQPDWALIDCRFTLAEPERGRGDYLQAHIPGAVYAHLNEHLSAPVVPGVTGRHPLPDAETVAERFSTWGIDSDAQVVAYDDAGGAYAARLWWMLRWLGHEAAAVLDGGWPAWTGAGLPVRGGAETRLRRNFSANPRFGLLADSTEVELCRSDAQWKVLDSRTAERYRGENETIDPIAGHIPGAVSAPYPDNLDPTAHFRSKEELHRRFEDLFGAVPASQAIFYCGSGVTAAHNILAAVHAGFEMPRLYVGSWSEWIIDPQRPVAVGEDTD